MAGRSRAARRRPLAAAATVAVVPDALALGGGRMLVLPGDGAIDQAPRTREAVKRVKKRLS